MNVDPSSRDGKTAAAFTLHGTLPDRETMDGWRRWRLTRHQYAPAPRIRLAEYRRLSPRQRQLHDLHRAATHANLSLQDTPMSKTVGRLMRSRTVRVALLPPWHRPTPVGRGEDRFRGFGGWRADAMILEDNVLAHWT